MKKISLAIAAISMMFAVSANAAEKMAPKAMEAAPAKAMEAKAPKKAMKKMDSKMEAAAPAMEAPAKK